MLYMIFSDNNLVKIGYAKDVSTRAKAYKTHNPNAEMKWKCAGDKKTELKARADLSAIAIERITGTEWFRVAPNIYDDLYNNGFKMIKSRAKVINKKA